MDNCSIQWLVPERCVSRFWMLSFAISDYQFVFSQSIRVSLERNIIFIAKRIYLVSHFKVPQALKGNIEHNSGFQIWSCVLSWYAFYPNSPASTVSSPWNFHK